MGTSGLGFPKRAPGVEAIYPFWGVEVGRSTGENGGVNKIFHWMREPRCGFSFFRVLKRLITFCAPVPVLPLRGIAFSIIVVVREPQKVRITLSLFVALFLGLALGLPAIGQESPAEDAKSLLPPEKAPARRGVEVISQHGITPAIQLLTEFRDSNVKFDLETLMGVLRDRQHEGWVLTAYPDPKTSRPLIGAGFSLDLPAREHPQHDALNPHPFLEPSSAELWQAAGLDADRLQRILDEFGDRSVRWSRKRFRSQVKTLPPDINEDESTELLRIAAIQAIYNARAYCRNFDELNGSQQMALSQLVYQMGVNLGEFSHFLALINGDPSVGESETGLFEAPPTVTTVERGPEFWTGVQDSLIQSQWAKLYRARAVSVIAMLDPVYADSPSEAERRVSAKLRPAVMHRHRGRASATRQVASISHRPARRAAKTAGRARSKRRA